MKTTHSRVSANAAIAPWSVIVLVATLLLKSGTNISLWCRLIHFDSLRLSRKSLVTYLGTSLGTTHLRYAAMQQPQGRPLQLFMACGTSVPSSAACRSTQASRHSPSTVFSTAGHESQPESTLRCQEHLDRCSSSQGKVQSGTSVQQCVSHYSSSHHASAIRSVKWWAILGKLLASQHRRGDRSSRSAFSDSHFQNWAEWAHIQSALQRQLPRCPSQWTQQLVCQIWEQWSWS